MRDTFPTVLMWSALLSIAIDTVAAERPYQDPSLPIEERVADLLGRMTLEEKIAQLCCLQEEKAELCDDRGRLVPEAAQRVMPHGIGQVARPSHRTHEGFVIGVDANRGPRETAEFVNAIQRYAVEETRLGIPIMFHGEGLHGYVAHHATSFPLPIALASAWDPELVEDVYYVVAREMRARGVTLALTPVLDVARDPRWGRIEETPGEDPYLVARFGVAAVRGFQGRTLPLAPDRVFATLKHFAAHGQPSNGTNIGPALFSERMVREVFLPPFEAAVREANAQCVMVTYNEIDGVPCAANPWLLREVLRDEWGFDGFTVSDYWAVPELADMHGVAHSHAEAVTLAINAGVDVELPNRRSRIDVNLREAVNNGSVAPRVLDEAVRNALRGKFRAGLFESPYAEPDSAEARNADGAAIAVARRAAERSIVLLKNRRNALPLDLTPGTRLAVIGPNAATTVLGGYSDVPKRTVSILEGVRNLAPDGVDVVYAEGCRITEGGSWWGDEVVLADPAENRKRIAEAAAVAERSDVLLVAVGGNEQTAREAWSKTHLGDRQTLHLIGEQEELLRALHATGKPMIVLLVNGRPLSVNFAERSADAVVECWCLGQETGTAVARVLFGDVSPGGKLPVSIPKNVGQLPMYYNHKPTARRGYMDGDTDPLYPFGFGLSYTTFRISEPRLSADTAACGESVKVSVDVSNTGSSHGDEVVQLYLRDRVASVTRPVKELRGFQRITLRPGQQETVQFVLGPDAFALLNRELKRVVQPGEFEVMVGPNSRELESTVLTLTGEETEIVATP